MAPSYQRFEAWREARVLVRMVYAETARWPNSERYGLTAQMRRAATSVILNIAEGAARRGRREFRRHTSIALASLAEVECGLLIAADVGVARADLGALEAQVRRSGQLLWRLHRSLSDP